MDKKLEEELGEFGKAIGRFFDTNSKRLADAASKAHQSVDETLKELDEFKGKWIVNAEKLVERYADELKTIIEKDPGEIESMEKGRALFFGAPIQAHGREGFFIGRFADPTDPIRPYSTTQYQVALLAPGKAYTMVVPMLAITVKV